MMIKTVVHVVLFRYERHIVFPKLLAQNTDGFEPGNTMYNRDVNKANSSRRWVLDIQII